MLLIAKIRYHSSADQAMRSAQPLRSSLVNRHTRTRGRVVESADIRTYRRRSGPDRWNNRPGMDWVVADKAPTHGPRSERLGHWVLRMEIV
jgi:hypothetical protein